MKNRVGAGKTGNKNTDEKGQQKNRQATRLRSANSDKPIFCNLSATLLVYAIIREKSSIFSKRQIKNRVGC